MRLGDGGDSDSDLTARQKRHLETVRDLLAYDQGLRRCELECRTEVRAMHRHAREADRLQRAGKLEQAVHSCEKALAAVEAIVSKEPESFEILAKELADVADVHARSRTAETPENESLQPLLTRIEQWRKARSEARKTGGGWRFDLDSAPFGSRIEDLLERPAEDDSPSEETGDAE